VPPHPARRVASFRPCGFLLWGAESDIGPGQGLWCQLPARYIQPGVKPHNVWWGELPTSNGAIWSLGGFSWIHEDDMEPQIVVQETVKGREPLP
jgi:hypothetical protein